ncbi:malonyl-CoA O-methyltransferase [Pseudomonas syringae pv. spinaceae]|uniref:Malonyl-CoA O-methyltransferase n=1 Tax=Pseudomonas syringae pv. spinaceae TaxID=264459 RepID=A0A0P9ZDB0_PSESX|nr:malonyl-CoA O-methyltransferase [Pseudomonas syringae pv. spinaceae]
MAGAHAYAELLVRAVDQVAGQAQTKLERTQRVIRASRHDVGQRIAVGSMLGFDRGRGCPGRVRGLGRYLGHTDRRPPAFTTDAQRVGVHHILPLGVVIHAVFGEVDDNPFARARRQNEAGRQHDVLAGTRQPRVHARVGGDHFQIAQVVFSAQVSEGIFVFGLNDLHLTNDVLARRRQWKLQSMDRARHAQSSKRQTAGNGWNARQHPGRSFG